MAAILARLKKRQFADARLANRLSTSPVGMAASYRALHRLGERYPALLALLIQLVVTLGMGLAIVAAAHLSAWRPSPLAAGLVHGLLCACLARWLGLSRWWWWLNLSLIHI